MCSIYIDSLHSSMMNYFIDDEPNIKILGWKIILLRLVWNMQECTLRETLMDSIGLMGLLSQTCRQYTFKKSKTPNYFTWHSRLESRQNYEYSFFLLQHSNFYDLI